MNVIDLKLWKKAVKKEDWQKIIQAIEKRKQYQIVLMTAAGLEVLEKRGFKVQQ